MIFHADLSSLELAVTDGDLVVTKSESDSLTSWPPLGAVLASNPNISRRLHQGNNHNISKCITE